LIRSNGPTFRDRGKNRQTFHYNQVLERDARLCEIWFSLCKIFTNRAIGRIMDIGRAADVVDKLCIMRVTTVVIARGLRSTIAHG
jgi:hypothetical protein